MEMTIDEVAFWAGALDDLERAIAEATRKA